MWLWQQGRSPFAFEPAQLPFEALGHAHEQRRSIEVPRRLNIRGGGGQLRALLESTALCASALVASYAPKRCKPT